MAQLIRFPVPPIPYPHRSTDLDTAEYALLIAVRWWVANHRNGTDPLPRLCQALGVAGVRDAAFSVDQLMSIVARTARHPIAIHCPCCPGLSADEMCLLHAAGIAQAGNEQLAEKALRTALLSAQGAEFALGPLEGLGELFAEARLFLRKRSAPWQAHTTPGTAAPKPAAIPAKTIH